MDLIALQKSSKEKLAELMNNRQVIMQAMQETEAGIMREQGKLDLIEDLLKQKDTADAETGE